MFPKEPIFIFLKSIIHNWDDDNAITILKNCLAAMSHSARLLLMERLIPTDPGASEAKLFDINMLVVLGGKERTEREYSDLLLAAGLRMINVIGTTSSLSIIEAVLSEV